MKTNYGELADRYTILQVKSRNGIITNSEEEAELYDVLTDKDLITDYDSEEIIKLSLINSEMWEIEDSITEENNLREIGIHCLALRRLNRSRIKIKNEITKKYGGYIEEKNY